MIGADVLHERIEPSAHPCESADSCTTANRTFQDHHRRAGNVSKTVRQQLATIEGIQHVRVELINAEQGRNRASSMRTLAARGSKSPNRRTLTINRGQIVVPTALHRTAERLAGRSSQRDVKRVGEAAIRRRLLDQQASGMRNLTQRILSFE